MNMLIPLLFDLAIPFILFLLFLLLWYIIVTNKYKKTEYFKANHSNYLKMRTNTGLNGEYLIYKCLQSLKGPHRFLFNVYLPKGNGETTEIDVLLIHSSGIFVFESKNYSGWIFGKENQKQWTQTLPSGGKSQKFHFLNPIMQNELHIKWLKDMLRDYKFIPYHSIIVFSERCTLKNIEFTEHKASVINRNHIQKCVESISQQSKSILSEQQILEIFEKLCVYTQVSEETKQKHIDDIKKEKPVPVVEPIISPLPLNIEQQPKIDEIKEVKDEIEQKKICPKCGKEMVLRTAKTGVNAGNQFWGCSGFPKCRNVVNSVEK